MEEGWITKKMKRLFDPVLRFRASNSTGVLARQRISGRRGEIFDCFSVFCTSLLYPPSQLIFPPNGRRPTTKNESTTWPERERWRLHIIAAVELCGFCQSFCYKKPTPLFLKFFKLNIGLLKLKLFLIFFLIIVCTSVSFVS